MWAVQFEAHRCCGSPIPEIVVQCTNTGDEHAARQRQPSAEDEDQQDRFVIHRRQEGDAETDQLVVTTADGNMTLRTVACFGQCALAPVIEVNHAIFGHMNEPTLQRELDALAQQEPRT